MYVNYDNEGKVDRNGDLFLGNIFDWINYDNEGKVDRNGDLFLGSTIYKL